MTQMLCRCEMWKNCYSPFFCGLLVENMCQPTKSLKRTRPCRALAGALYKPLAPQPLCGSGKYMPT